MGEPDAPTSWPVGANADYGPIMSYLNWYVLAARVHMNEARAARGEPPLTTEEQWWTVYLPLFKASQFSAIGIQGIGGHEYMGQQAIIDARERMLRLWKATLSDQPPAPAPTPTPTPGVPPVIDPTGPVPPGTPPPGPVPALDETAIDFANGISLRLYVNDTRMPSVGMGKVLRLTPETVAFHFGNPSNLEVVVKVLDGRGVNGRYWIFAAGLTDVGCKLIAVKGGSKKEYINAQGTPFQPIQDTAAFPA
jgi:hypothetical protein